MVSKLQDDTSNAADQQLRVTEEVRGFYTKKMQIFTNQFLKLLLNSFSVSIFYAIVLTWFAE